MIFNYNQQTRARNHWRHYRADIISVNNFYLNIATTVLRLGMFAQWIS